VGEGVGVVFTEDTVDMRPDEVECPVVVRKVELENVVDLRMELEDLEVVRLEVEEITCVVESDDESELKCDEAEELLLELFDDDGDEEGWMLLDVDDVDCAKLVGFFEELLLLLDLTAVEEIETTDHSKQKNIHKKENRMEYILIKCEN